MRRTDYIKVDDLVFEVISNYTEAIPAKLDGPPELCYEAEPANVELDSVQLGNYELLDYLNEPTLKIIEDTIEKIAENEEQGI